jgi:4-hydroxy-tetrahydrodipicolinate reductase
VTEGSSDIAIPVVLMGLGAVGQAIARAALEKPELSVVAAVDPSHAGKQLGAVLGGPAPRLTITDDPGRAFQAAKGGVVLHATGSRFRAVLPQIERSVEHGLCVVSTCEELAYPWWSDPDAADALARRCEEHDVAVVGTGVNPGFVLDRLPAMLAQVAGPVRRVRARRVVDASNRRPGLQRKIGMGLTPEAWAAAAERGEIGHVGLAESALLVADACGLDVEELELEEELQELLAEEDVPGDAPVPAGAVAGVEQTVRGYVDGVERVGLDLRIYAGAEDPHGEIEITGPVPLNVTIRGGLSGEETTAWAVVNAAPAIRRMRGLVTVLELPAGG